MREDLPFTRRLRLPPLWTLLLAFVVGFAVVLWRAIGLRPGAESFPSVPSLLWPGAVTVVAVYAFAWLGWALDID